MQTCRVIRPGADYEGQQGIGYGAGVSAETAGSRGLCLHTLTLPPGGRGHAGQPQCHPPLTRVVARTDPNEQESVLLPEADGMVRPPR